MSGLRIYHPEVRSAVVVIPVPPKGAQGTAKEVQIVVDDTGHSLVSEGVWAEIDLALQAGNNAGFIIINEVPDPPALLVGGEADFGRQTVRVEADALRTIAPAGVNVQVVEHGLPPSV